MTRTANGIVMCGFAALAAAGCRQQHDDAGPAPLPEAAARSRAGAGRAAGRARRFDAPGAAVLVRPLERAGSTWLDPAASGDHDRVKIRTLDGETRYEGRAAGDHIDFERNGSSASIGASDGAATGMKWLADKKDCLTIESGEGCCRD
ncbi:hypothetical protein [Solimonas soli]|uniref:hypothetical protein n=1 Tax=Solimonas soli TaxID=413479 RepID=UPI0012F92BB8|nr:hypothetical protein [Solimonas soli]